jgi:YHS domain-containing protein
MLRAIVDFVLLMIVFAALRAVISAVSKSVGGSAAGPASCPMPPRNVPTGGELKRDPVCGTFVPVIGSPHKNVNGITQYFCSQNCLDRFRPA